MEPRRVVLAVVLMALVLVGVPLIFPNPPATPTTGTSAADSAATRTAAGAPQVTAPQGAAMAAAPRAADSAPGSDNRSLGGAMTETQRGAGGAPLQFYPLRVGAS